MKISFSWGKKSKAIPTVSFEECLSKNEADQLRKHDFEKVAAMPRADRLKLFTSLFGDRKAEFVNARLESDLILPNQKAGLMNWINANQEVKPKWRKEIIREISALDRAMDPAEKNTFIEHLANLSLGIGVTFYEAKVIFDLSNAAKAARARLADGGSTADYEKAKKALDDYVAQLKTERD